MKIAAEHLQGRALDIEEVHKTLFSIRGQDRFEKPNG